MFIEGEEEEGRGGVEGDVTNWKVIRQEWETTDITFVDLADKYSLRPHMES